jgi:hypothetical protein
MEEMNIANSQYKYGDIDRPMEYGDMDKHMGYGDMDNHMDYDKNYPFGYGFKKHCPYGNCQYGNCPYGNCQYGTKFPYGSYFPGPFYGSYGFPWFLFALKSLSPRDAVRYMDEMDGMYM